MQEVKAQFLPQEAWYWWGGPRLCGSEFRGQTLRPALGPGAELLRGQLQPCPLAGGEVGGHLLGWWGVEGSPVSQERPADSCVGTELPLTQPCLGARVQARGPRSACVGGCCRPDLQRCLQECTTSSRPSIWETQQWAPRAQPQLPAQDCLGLMVGAVESEALQWQHQLTVSLGMAVSSWGPWGFSQSRQPGLSLPDERDRVQKKTFTKWVNKHLIKVGGVCTHGQM